MAKFRTERPDLLTVASVRAPVNGGKWLRLPIPAVVSHRRRRAEVDRPGVRELPASVDHLETAGGVITRSVPRFTSRVLPG